MPVYDYKCSDHGLFYELASINDASKPQACPHCGNLCARVIMLSPEFLDIKSQRHQAQARNEAAQHTPILSTPEYRAEKQARLEHKHGKGCGCGDKKLRKSNLMYTAEGNKMFPSMRPWMISH